MFDEGDVVRTTFDKHKRTPRESLRRSNGNPPRAPGVITTSALLFALACSRQATDSTLDSDSTDEYVLDVLSADARSVVRRYRSPERPVLVDGTWIIVTAEKRVHLPDQFPIVLYEPLSPAEEVTR